MKDTILGCGYDSYKEWLRGMVSPDVEANHIAVIGLRILLNVNKYYILLHCNILIYTTIKCNKIHLELTLQQYSVHTVYPLKYYFILYSYRSLFVC